LYEFEVDLKTLLTAYNLLKAFCLNLNSEYFLHVNQSFFFSAENPCSQSDKDALSGTNNSELTEAHF